MPLVLQKFILPLIYLAAFAFSPESFAENSDGRVQLSVPNAVIDGGWINYTDHLDDVNPVSFVKDLKSGCKESCNENVDDALIFHEYLQQKLKSAPNAFEYREAKRLLQPILQKASAESVHVLTRQCAIENNSAFFDPAWLSQTENFLKRISVNVSDAKLQNEIKQDLSCLAKSREVYKENDLRSECESGASDFSSNFPPLRHQGFTDWCWANSAADLLSYYEHTDVSPAFLAVDTWKNLHHEKGNMLEEDNPMLALVDANTSGYCLEKDSPSEFTNKDRTLHELYDLYDEIGLFDRSGKKFPDLQCELSRELYQNVGHTMFPNLNFNAFFAILHAVADKGIDAKLVEENCKDKIHPVRQHYNWELRTLDTEKIRDKFLLLRDLLKKQPVIVTTSWNGLHYGYHGQAPQHGVSVVGMRWNKQQKVCELRLRDSGNSSGQEWVSMMNVLGSLDEIIQQDDQVGK